MKQIIAFIKPNKLPAVTLALQSIEGLPGMSFTEVRGFGRERFPKSDPGMVRELVDCTPHVRVEVFCPEDLVYELQYVIRRAAHDDASDSQVFVMEGGKGMGVGEAEPVELVI
jgi:nitrogen regulatory protein PII